MRSKLYQFKIAPIVNRVLAVNSSERTQLFHKRMGHLNLKSLRLLQHLADGVVLDKDPEENCESCVMAKAHKLPFPPSKSLARNIGELTHVDLCHIGAEDIHGNIMFMVVTDDASRFCTIYLLKHKDDSEDWLISYDKKILVKTGKHLGTLRSDGGGEFFNNSFREYCDSHGISQQSSTPYTPQQNGRAERINRTVLEGTSAMLFDASLPFEYWGLAAQCFIYVKNRSPHQAIYRSTPYQEWHQRLPDLTNVRVFGCKCFVYVPSETRKKLGPGNKLLPKARKMMFVGYSDKHKAWKTIDSSTKEIVFSSNVIFESENNRNIQPNTATLFNHAAPLNSNITPIEQGEAHDEGEGSDEGEVSLDQGEGPTTNSRHDPSETPSESHANHQQRESNSSSTNNIDQQLESNSSQAISKDDAESITTIGPYQTEKVYKTSAGKFKYVDSSTKKLRWDPSTFSQLGSRRNRDDESFSSNAFNAFASWLTTQDISDAFSDVSLEDVELAFSAHIAQSKVSSEPSFSAAMSGPDKQNWEAAIASEYKSLDEHGVFSKPCPLPANYKTLDTKMVLKIKEPEGHSNHRRYKARLCARGFRQEKGVDFDFTFAPVATYHAFRLFLSIMASKDFEIHTVDVKTAFLHSILKETIYISIPDGYPNAQELKKDGQVLQLLKCLYGLKQSPMEWNGDLNDFLKSLGFIPCQTEPCVYVNHNR
jgi:transposase InsO family protein